MSERKGLARQEYVAEAKGLEEVPPGYKRTEVGVIPEDWEVKTISDVANVKTGPFGSALHERDYVQNGTPIITVEHLSEQGVVHENLPLVSDADRARLKSYSLRENDIVFSRVGSVDRNSIIRKAEDKWLFSGRLLRVRISNNSLWPPYLSYHFHSEPFKKRVREVAVGQTMASLNTQILKGIDVVLPKHDEQRAIATALSDTDALIESLDRLIAKKRAIKQATMQQLLTGKTRLPGFEGEWETKRLGDIFTITRGQVVSFDKLYSEMIGQYKYPVYSSQTMHNGLCGYYKQYLFENCITWTTDGANAGAVKFRAGKFDAFVKSRF